MTNDLDLQRIKNVEERVAKLEQKVNGISTPILDAIESFRVDTLRLFEGLATRIETRLDASDAKTAERFSAADKRFDELLAEIRKGSR